MNSTAPGPLDAPGRWERFSRSFGVGLRRYAEWLVSISWKKFFLLSVLLLLIASILQEIPPFSFRYTVSTEPASAGADRSAAREERLRRRLGDINISIDGREVKIRRGRDERKVELPKPAAPDPAPGAVETPPGASPSPPGPGGVASFPPLPSPPAAPQRPEAPGEPKNVVEIGRDGVTIRMPPDVAKDVKDAIEGVRGELREVIDEAIAEEIAKETGRPRVRTVKIGSYLPQLALVWIFISMLIKIVYAGRVKAEVKAAEAQETADSESLKRQVVEARLAAMQAQVEPHFLFNTLASIDHLIETDPGRASKMQKNLIALLRASMPGMREAETNLGRELAVVRPYLEILRVRMGDRLQTEIRVSEGLHSADFPPMMLQSLVENAIKHGLEPKPEGGTLAVAAEVAHGKLEVTVADTGVGFGQAATAGTGVGLVNIRERLKLLYGNDGELRIAENAPSGTRITVVVPYRTAGNATRA